MNSFEENLKNAFSCSAHRLALETKKSDPGCRQLEEARDELFQEIQTRLGEDAGLLLRLEEKQNELDSVTEDCIYLQGMIDCVVLLKTIRLL